MHSLDSSQDVTVFKYVTQKDLSRVKEFHFNGKFVAFSTGLDSELVRRPITTCMMIVEGTDGWLSAVPVELIKLGHSEVPNDGFARHHETGQCFEWANAPIPYYKGDD